MWLNENHTLLLIERARARDRDIDVYLVLLCKILVVPFVGVHFLSVCVFCIGGCNGHYKGFLRSEYCFSLSSFSH